MKYLILTLLFCFGCSIENIEEPGIEAESPDSDYEGILEGIWTLMNIKIDGSPELFMMGTLKLYSNWDYSLSIGDINGYGSIVSSGKWNIAEPNHFIFLADSSTNTTILEEYTNTNAKYIFIAGIPRKLNIEYKTSAGLIVDMDFIK